MVKLAEIAEIFLGRPPAKVDEGATTATAPIVALRDVASRITPRDRLEEVEVSGDPDPQRRLRRGDIVVTARGRIRSAVAEAQHEQALLGPNLLLVRLRESIPPEVVAAYIRHPLVAPSLLSDQGVSATASLAVDALRSLELAQLDVDCAEALAELVRETEDYRDEIEEGLVRLTEATAAAVFVKLAPAP